MRNIFYDLDRDEHLELLNLGKTQSDFIMNYFCYCDPIEVKIDTNYNVCNHCNKQTIRS